MECMKYKNKNFSVGGGSNLFVKKIFNICSSHVEHIIIIILIVHLFVNILYLIEHVTRSFAILIISPDEIDLFDHETKVTTRQGKNRTFDVARSTLFMFRKYIAFEISSFLRAGQPGSENG